VDVSAYRTAAMIVEVGTLIGVECMDSKLI
jgi:hypothetical protein